jgi:hypothetical protein
MNVWFRGSLLLAATLSAGIAIGIWFERSHAPGLTTNAAHEHVMRQLHHSLRLDSAQRASISETLRRHQLLVDSVWGEMRPHVNATLDSAHRAIMGVLTPHQKETFEHMIRQRHGHAAPDRH